MNDRTEFASGAAPASTAALLHVVIVVLCWAASVNAQTPETRAFEAAVGAFEDRAPDLADKRFREFLQNYPNSPRAAEAILYRARAALLQRDTQTAISLLTTNAPRAAQLQDQYRYWLGETHREATNYTAAAETFASLLRDFPNSGRVLEASYGEAIARFKLHEWPRVINLLRSSNAPFAKEAQARPNHELVLRGHLLLAEALLENGDSSAAESVLGPLHNRELTPEFRWRAEYLRCRARLAEGRADAALAVSTNLVALAAATGDRSFVAESHAVHGAVLERLSDHPAAILAYQRNVTETTPAEHRRQALLRIIQLTLDQNELAEAAEKLESFFLQYPQDAASEVALLTLGELNLRRHVAPEAVTNAVPRSTNFLHVALAHFDRLITNHPNSTLLGQAHLDRGWCLWLDGKFSEAQFAFQAATNHLPNAESEAVAQFKLADIAFERGDFTNALANYRSVITGYKHLPRVQEELAQRALYQVLRVSLALNDLTAADSALKDILRGPESPFAERGLLLFGQKLSAERRAADGRALFEQFLERYPDSPLRPEVELAIARSYFYENQWAAALQKYQEWLDRFSASELRPRAEFSYAHVTFQAGQLTNAVSLFTNFLARFPGDSNAPVAKYSIGAIYYEQRDYVRAEYHFQGLFQNTNWATNKLAYTARIMAARSAYARQDFKAAYDYCLTIANDTNATPELTVEAFFLAGDALVQQSDPARPPLANFEEAIKAFNKIIVLYPTNSSAALAWGRIGDCYFQLASRDPKLYDAATNAYFQVLNSPAADVAARSQARVGIGLVFERLAAAAADPAQARTLRTLAFESYYSVINPTDIEPAQRLDPYWFRAAGLAAARVAEQNGQWETAARIYTRLIDALPPPRANIERRLQNAREQAATGSL